MHGKAAGPGTQGSRDRPAERRIMIHYKPQDYNDQLQQDIAAHGPWLTGDELFIVGQAMQGLEQYVKEYLQDTEDTTWIRRDLTEQPLNWIESEVMKTALDIYAADYAARGQLDEVLTSETIAGVIDKCCEVGDTAKIKELDAADDGTKSGTGAADPGTVSEIMKRLNRIEESLHSIGQQVEAIWLKTGAVELDAESIAEDLEETDTEQ